MVMRVQCIGCRASREIVKFNGQCRCGNIAITFETDLTVKNLPIRACSCSFCSKHSARTTTDPNGRASIVVREGKNLQRFRFEMQTADFLVCKKCGIYVGALLTEGDKSYATLNINTFTVKLGLQSNSKTVSYDGESKAERIARRRKNWTPCTLEIERKETLSFSKS